VTLLRWEALKEAVECEELSQRLVVTPLLDFDKQIGPASVDLRLGTEFRVLRRTDESGLDPGDQPQSSVERMTTTVNVEVGDKLWCHLGVLARTTQLGCVCPGAFVVGTSGPARCHSNLCAAWVFWMLDA
jgi:dCTP deaminase